MRTSCCSLLLVTLGLAACTKSGTYRYESKFEVRFPPDYDAAPITAEARALLAKARVVAFVPPDSCAEPEDRRDGITAQARLLRLDCGVIVSSLERSAEEAGYRVVSFRTLRGNERPIDYAKRSEVDVLFEINELAFDQMSEHETRAKLAFFQVTDVGSVPATPRSEVADRCEVHAQELTARDVATSGTLDIKMVRVSDGQNLWHYRRTRAAHSEGTATQTFRKTRAVNPLFPTLLVGGGTLLIGGLAADNNSALLLSGGIAAAIGLIGIISSGEPDADEVLCDGPALEEHVTANRTRETAKQLRTAIVEDFLVALSDVRQSPSDPAEVVTTPAALPAAAPAPDPAPTP